MRRLRVLKGLALFAGALLFVAALSIAVMLLWNALIPSLFSGPVLGFWQAAGLLVLCRILFGRFGGPHGHSAWRQRAWQARWSRMTPEERDRFRDGMRRWKQTMQEQRWEFGDYCRTRSERAPQGAGEQPPDNSSAGPKEI